MSFNYVKFFDPAVEEVSQQPSIASLMASKGVLNHLETPVAEPVDIKEVNGTQPAETNAPTPAETANEVAKEDVVDAKESQQPKKDKDSVEDQKESITESKVKSWQEVLKSQQPSAILKELGFDDSSIPFIQEMKKADPKMVSFFNHWKSKGDVKEYLRELNTDYASISSEEVMKHQLRKEYPKASDKQLEALYNKEIVEAYKLDPDVYSEEEVDTGRLLLDAKADKYREELVKKQQDYLLPSYVEPAPETPAIDIQEQEAQKEFEAFKSNIIGHKYTKGIFENKSFTFGEGDSKFSFPVDPNELVDSLFTDKWSESLVNVVENKDGSKEYIPNVEHMMLVAAVSKYGEAFMQAYAKHFRALGGSKLIDSIENATKPETNASSQSQPAFKNAAEAMAKTGRLVN